MKIEQDLLELAALENGVDPDLLRDLIGIRSQSYPELHKWGSCPGFEKGIGDFIERAAGMEEGGGL